jgi:hypothetical protein
MAKSLLPQAFWFRVAIACPRIEDIPRANDRRRLLDLPVSCTLPDFQQLEGRASWAEIRVGWNPRGLGLAVMAQGAGGQPPARDRPEGFAVAQFWVDTRDTRNVSRATRFCHRYMAVLEAREGRGQLGVQVAQRPIARAVADAPQCRPGSIAAKAELGRDDWMLELFLPAEVLNGFDPETNRRLGFAYQIADHVRDDQFLGVGRDFPLGENPSLWATLELKD